MVLIKNLLISILLSLCSCLDAQNVHQARLRQQPNVVVILVDDMGWTDLGCYGSDLYQTPAIDNLAAQGIRFTNAYSSCTVCSPTRASVMTGQNPARLKLTDWIEGHKYPWAKLQVPDWTMQLDSGELTMAEAFQRAGYRTAHIGKWHLGEEKKDWPEHHGFEINIGGWAKGGPFRNNQKGYSGYFSPYGNPRMTDGEDGEYLTERLAEEACLYISENSDQPFFLNLWFYNVHMPLQAKQDKIDKYKRMVHDSKRHNHPVYAAMVEHTDEAIGKVIQTLKDKGQFGNTIILFASDNGGLIGSGKTKVTNNYPLRKGKGSMYEGGVRVPTIIYSPFHKSNSRVVDVPVISSDYFPTLLALAGLDISKNDTKKIDGVSWAPLLNGEPQLSRDALFWHYPHYHQEGAVPHSVIRKGDWKLLRNYELNTWELYNLNEDIGEENNLINVYQKKADALKDELNQWLNDIDAQMPVDNPYYDPTRERKKSKKQ